MYEIVAILNLKCIGFFSQNALFFVGRFSVIKLASFDHKNVKKAIFWHFLGGNHRFTIVAFYNSVFCYRFWTQYTRFQEDMVRFEKTWEHLGSMFESIKDNLKKFKRIWTKTGLIWAEDSIQSPNGKPNGNTKARQSRARLSQTRIV